MGIFSHGRLLWILLLACLSTRHAADATDLGSSPVATIKAKVLFSLEYGAPTYPYGGWYDDAQTPCVRIAEDFNKQPGRIHDYLNPRGRWDPTFGWGCTFDLRSLPGGQMTPNVHYQNWITRVFLCPEGYGPPGNITGGPNPSATCQAGGGVVPWFAQTNQCAVGNPIHPGSGTKLQIERDIEPLNSGLQFVRYYRTHSYTDWAALLPSAADTLGRRWSHTYSARLTFAFDSSGVPQTVFSHRADGSGAIYVRGGSGLWISKGDTNDHLIELISSGTTMGWKLVEASTQATEIYNASGQLQSITSRAGITQTLKYSSAPGTSVPFSQMLLSVSDSFGHSISFSYNANAQMEAVTGPTGSMVTYGYTDRILTSVTYAGSATRMYHYNEPAYRGSFSASILTGITDESGTRFAIFKYDSSGRAISTEHAGGAGKIAVSYGTGSRTVTDALSTARSFGYQTSLGVPLNISVNQPCVSGCGASAAVTAYDANSNISSREDFNGNETQYAYDTVRNLETSRTEASGTPSARTITTQWHSTYRLPTLITQPGKTTAFTHDARGNVLTRIETDTATGTSRTWTYTYNSYSQVLTVDGPRTDISDVTAYTYYNCTTGYQCGQVATITNAAGHVTTFNTYNAHAKPLTITDPNDVVTTLTYDLRQRMTSRTVGTEQTTFEYWPTGLLKKVTLPDASFLSYTYDAAHRLTGISDDEGNHIAYTLDAMGNHTAEQIYDPSSTLTQTRTRVFNSLNQLWKELGAAGTANVTTSFGYDGNGNQTTINAPLSRNTTQAYDELNRLTRITDPLSGVTQYGYNALDQLISVTDPRNKTTSYTYNALGDLTEQVSPDTGTTTNTYDSGGNLQTSTDARSKTATYTYDALNRVTSITYPDQAISYTYDTGTNQNGRLTQVTDNSGITAWAYDAQGRVLSRQQTMGAISKTLGYGYDASGSLQTLTLPSGNTITYGYSHGRIDSLTLNGSTVILADVLYEPFGPTRGWTWGNGTLSIREYDTDGKITDIDSAGLKSYSYDDAFRITAITDASDPNLSQSYGYDLLDRLTSATGASVNQGWTYDANGNRLTQTGDQPSTYTISSTSNRLNSISGALSRAYSYDDAGNTTSDGTVTFTYNDAGRMVSATKAGVTTTYLLNTLGQRVRKTTTGISTYFVYDEAGRLVGEYDSSGSLIQETVWLADIPVATFRPSGAGVDLFYLHADHLNTPRRISRPGNNVVVWRWDSNAFGSDVPNEDSDGDGDFLVHSLRFPGQYADPETGLHYNYFRDYDPTVGRYAQSDPLGMVDGPSTYAYVRNYSVGLTDRYGLMSDDECCLRSQQLGQNRNAQGWAICCEGRKVPCSFAPKVMSKAGAIRRKCTIEHEKSHLAEIECDSCTKDPVRPNRSGPGAMDYNLSECTAGKRGLDCYRRGIRECGNDEQCRKEIQDTIFRLGRYYEGCWGGI